MNKLRYKHGLVRQIRFEKDDLDVFERLYPELLQLFLNRAVKVAISSREDFDRIFFTPLVCGDIVVQGR